MRHTGLFQKQRKPVEVEVRETTGGRLHRAFVAFVKT